MSACHSSKAFPGTERVNIQFCVETFNISNTPNLLTANNNSNNQAFGNVSIGMVSATDPNYVPRQYRSHSRCSSRRINPAPRYQLLRQSKTQARRTLPGLFFVRGGRNDLKKKPTSLISNASRLLCFCLKSRE